MLNDQVVGGLDGKDWSTMLYAEKILNAKWEEMQEDFCLEPKSI